MKRIQHLIFLILRFFVLKIYPKTEVVGAENLPDTPCIIAGNHSQMNGPIIGELYFPGRRYIWCAGEMMHLKEVPSYAYRDFWSRKSKTVRWVFKLLSYLIAPLAVCLFNSAHTIAVYHDKRVIHTFRETLTRLKEGNNVIIFPEHDVPYNHIVCDFQEGFVDIARSYYKQTGKELDFVPLYVAPKLRKIFIGKPIRFCADCSIKEERARICNYLMQEITEQAMALPIHTVVPYNNLPKSQYGTNIPSEEKE